ncbi:MAG: (5-formylfuran-3-yl)methyl phosphate synthase [Bacteroidota bacterium]
MKQRLLVSIRGPKEAETAIRGGAHIVDVEYPASALGTPYPLNIFAVVEEATRSGAKEIQVSTNIGEIQSNRSNSCLAALGVASAGADLIKFGLAELSIEPAIYLGRNIIRTVKHWFPDKRLFPAVFVDTELREIFDPFSQGKKLVQSINADGLLVDTFDKSKGQGLLDYCPVSEIASFVETLHSIGREAWIAGSISQEEIVQLWKTGVDVICVRGAACKPNQGVGRFGEIDEKLVRTLLYN